MAQEEKLKALDAAISQIERQYGKGSVMKLGDTSSHMKVETVPTGSISLDIALGQGGLPKGRIIEIYGPESSGKTTVALHAVAEVQKAGGIAGFIDAEHALDPVYAKNIGVDIDNLYISQPGQWRAGHGDHGDHGALACDRYRDRGLCGGAGAQGGDRRGHGRFPCGLQARLMSPGAAETDSSYQQVQLHRHLHQSAP